MSAPLMPKATAVWLIENTSLTFEQVAKFCQLHPIEVQAIADGESSVGMIGLDPIATAQLTWEEIHRCEGDKTLDLQIQTSVNLEQLKAKKKKTRYTPVLKRQDRPDAIAWLLKYYPDIADMQICKLVGTTKNMIQSIKTKSHWNYANIKPRNPAHIGLCSQEELDEVISKF